MTQRPVVAHAVLVHGAGAGGWEWTIWRGVLAAHGVEALALDLAAHDAVAATTFDDYRAQVAAALAALPRPRVLAGASLGGLLAAACADATDALVLVNPMPPAPWAGQLPRRDWPDVVPWGRDARLDGTRRALGDADDASALRALRGWREESGAVLRAAQDGIEVERPGCPVWFAAGGADNDVPVGATRAWASAWEAPLHELPGAGHVEPLLGRRAAGVADAAARWLVATLSPR
ncbi:alpha/beta hydrolase [Cognatilysobacter tabacisoli]|uniref:alpha/beta hydrolase n=1 Tax=Cognatilysobacter tabacisoli TaxID=2315424 RepID=UPI0013009C0A|nr:alpha/beta hydrolase [Lysobacter tabacisoli]